MAMIFNEADVPAQPFGVNAARQALITSERIRDTRMLVDRWRIGASGKVELRLSPGSGAWFAVLEGEARLRGPGVDQALTAAHAVYFDHRFEGSLGAEKETTLLYVEIPDASRYAVDFEPAPVKVIDWMTEPMLDSKHDARKRIYMATPKLFGTRALKCEMIIYPGSTSGSKHRHEGAEHFKYVLEGTGTGYADDDALPHRAGDVVYHPGGEWHYSVTRPEEGMRFIEFFVPGVFETVWASDRVCSWEPTGRSMLGGKPVREIAAHAGNAGTPTDV